MKVPSGLEYTGTFVICQVDKGEFAGRVPNRIYFEFSFYIIFFGVITYLTLAIQGHCEE
jgi:hypothetical protein